jgi:hypothetical protein
VGQAWSTRWGRGGAIPLILKAQVGQVGHFVRRVYIRGFFKQSYAKLVIEDVVYVVYERITIGTLPHLPHLPNPASFGLPLRADFLLPPKSRGY